MPCPCCQVQGFHAAYAAETTPIATSRWKSGAGEVQGPARQGKYQVPSFFQAQEVQAEFKGEGPRQGNLQVDQDKRALNQNYSPGMVQAFHRQGVVPKCPHLG